MRSKKSWVQNSVLVALLFLVKSTIGGYVVAAQDEAKFNKGKEVFKINCAVCHGDNGDGQGPAGKALKPPPRTYSSDAFKQGCKEEDLFKTVNKGVPGTMMTSFAHLPEEEKKAVAHYVFQNWVNNKNPKCKKAWAK